ncbi:MAG: DUF6152 family protein [Candidatus Acidiferrales bacterium]
MICDAVFAHHGVSGSYDRDVRISVKATVTNIVWANPHAQIYFDFKNDKGETEHWAIELLSPGNLVRIGWYRNTFKPGDSILVSMYPAKDDRPFGSCGHIVSADGQKFITGQCGTPGADFSKLPVKPGYTAVEVKMPEFPAAQVAGPLVPPKD